MHILVLHGPNLNLLGERKPEVYGHQTLQDLDDALRARAAELDVVLKTFQSNHEGALLDKLHEERRWLDGLIINAGAYTHTSWALRDAIEAVGKPAYEVHLSDIHAREAFRAHSCLVEVCVAQISGKGIGSYLEALERLAAG